ncbi:FMN-binding negative transcriptional regulator [Mesorhizobium sp. ANAO-SY3R2]|uniref:FMN-binding negative transcriptional regulator n=1 Tax=Mesorhizobium sp. ANAO-SY3R2 TaxID=3166644 RepID=UPI00366C4DD4
MYQPPLFKETRLDVLHALIRAHPLGLLISNGPDGPEANPLPFLLDAEPAPYGRLRAHLARANPQWRVLADSPDALIVFQGVDSYITPSWYATKRETGKVVPTWNYAMVQVRGRVRVVDDGEWLAGQIAELTATHEGSRAEPWQVSDAPDAYIAAQMKGIVGLEIEITEIEGKWKVSQNRPVADRVGVAEGLETGKPSAEHAEMAQLVRRYGGLEGE